MLTLIQEALEGIGRPASQSHHLHHQKEVHQTLSKPFLSTSEIISYNLLSGTPIYKCIKRNEIFFTSVGKYPVYQAVDISVELRTLMEYTL